MKTRFHRASAGGYSFAETLVGAVLIAVIGGFSMQLLISGFMQFARNVALNQSAEQSRATLTTVIRRMEAAADNPQLVTLGGSPESLTQTTTTYAQGVRFHRMLGGAYKITGPISTTTGTGPSALSYTSNTTTTLTLSYSSAFPVPSVGDRIMFLNPSTIKETISTGTSPGVKPGRRIIAVGSPSGTALKTVTVTLESGPGRPVLCNNPCHVVREAALVAVDVGDRRQLRYYDSTASLSSYVVLSRELDPDPKARDASGTIIKPFGLATVNGKRQVLVDLPIRVHDYRASLARVRPADEFHGFLRTGSRVVLKTNLALE